ncbi:hypothetical protein GGI20_003166 [Coemansia sp. BCRC 34301]|nr:hypothetical protein GGI20_003166 [Coemansia sp. BCRC 34301]
MLAALYSLLIGFSSILYALLVKTMNSHGARDPREVTVADRKKTLHELHRRAKHLDRKWIIGLSKPDGMTILSMVPFVGSAMSTTLSVGYLRRINGTFFLSEEVENEMMSNIVANTLMAAIPLVGWVTRRCYNVNKRNYKILEEYVMAMPLREVPQRNSTSATTSHRHRHRHSRHDTSNLTLRQDDATPSAPTLS